VLRPPYPVLGLDEICALPVGELADRDAHLYLWTTQKFLRDSWLVAEAWGFRVSATLVWCKSPVGARLGGAFPASLEFIQFCRRGKLAATGQADKRWWHWPRRRGVPVALGEARNGGHSAKPEAFLDIVEQVSPGPYLELFARRQRLGWDTWGDEALQHVDLSVEEA
jgi:N6-adenosine-specific RNA methylase IME4